MPVGVTFWAPVYLTIKWDTLFKQMLQILQGGGGGGGIDMEGLVREVLLGPILTLILFKTNIFQSYVRHNALFFDPVF